MPKISIVLPVYNVEKYLPECIESLVNQTLNDLEFIFIDDGSTDNSIKILEGYAKNDSRFVIISQKNQGPGIARNMGLKLAKGEYVTCLDPDDWFELNAMEVLYKKLKETGAVALQFDWKSWDEITNSSYFCHNSFEERIIKLGCSDILKSGYFDWRTYKSLFFILSGGTWGRIYSTKFIRENNIRFSDIFIGEDRLFGVMTLICAPKIYYLNEFFYNYRIRSSSLTRKPSERYFNCPFVCYDEIEEFLKSKGCFEDLKEVFYSSRISFYRMVFNLLPNSRKKEYKKLCRKKLPYEDYKNVFKLKESFIKNIFSIENVSRHDGRYKQIVIFGFPIEIKKKN